MKKANQIIMTNNISTKKIIISMLVVIVLGFLIGRYAFNLNDNNQAMTGTEQGSERELATNEGTNMEDEIMMDDSSPNDSMTRAGLFTDYDPALLANANEGEVILFFDASWCPSCRGLNKDIDANLDNIPENVTILRVNYDTATDLKKKYGIVRQHTLVRVDANGDKIETLTGLTNTLDQVLRQI